MYTVFLCYNIEYAVEEKSLYTRSRRNTFHVRVNYCGRQEKTCFGRRYTVNTQRYKRAARATSDMGVVTRTVPNIIYYVSTSSVRDGETKRLYTRREEQALSVRTARDCRTTVHEIWL